MSQPLTDTKENPMKKLGLFLLSLCFICSCATNSSSSFMRPDVPEITIKGDLKVVKAFTIERLQKRGFTIEKQSYSAVSAKEICHHEGEQPCISFAPFGCPIFAKVFFTQIKEDTKISMTLYYTYLAGFPKKNGTINYYVIENPMQTQEDYDNIQKFLNSLK